MDDESDIIGFLKGWVSQLCTEQARMFRELNEARNANIGLLVERNKHNDALNEIKREATKYSDKLDAVREMLTVHATQSDDAFHTVKLQRSQHENLMRLLEPSNDCTTADMPF